MCIFQLEKHLLLNLPIGYTGGFLASEHDSCLVQKILDTIPLLRPPVPFGAGVANVAPWESSSGMHYSWAHPCMNPSKKRKGLKNNKIPLSSCSEDTVLTNSPQKARSCNLLLRRDWEGSSQVPVISACEVQAWKHENSHRRCPFERLENVETPATLCWGKSRLQQKALSTQHRIISSRFIHFSWHLYLSYRCCTTFRIEPLTIQLFEHMCIFHSTNRKNMATGLQRLDPRARMREAEKVFLWEISVVSPVVSLFLILFADCTTPGPWGR